MRLIMALMALAFGGAIVTAPLPALADDSAVPVSITVNDPNGGKFAIAIFDSSGSMIWSETFMGNASRQITLAAGDYTDTMRVNDTQPVQNSFSIPAGSSSFALSFTTNAPPPPRFGHIVIRVRDPQHHRITVRLQHNGQLVWRKVFTDTQRVRLRERPGWYRLVFREFGHVVDNFKFQLQAGTTMVSEFRG